ncbi:MULTISPECIES: bifunctional 2-polyprenyl-6-hydroxyphenol methylase/3-demethylubiquinol 3-O-methyltransferase UbiG [Nocardiaceae]|uniref:SAM-dependent methyltransferase n=1 Tax=Rhodococcoides corynebacterioides TaxID=53972 RepID=A0ABS2KTS9_9NOCA|nr:MULTISPECIES: class I SAM-dependent methyltransferase [Rhodococcus]MBM7415055.1 SAM-dependent methyltransferase [Rhodococcus corynebacterioides]MBP1117517.1 SAM-dependent methyltransferase [Rhodococcus sp. PvP016]
MNDAATDTTVSTETPLPLTGERTVPGIAEENYWFRRHEVVYRRLAPACADRVVLEAGSGEGYGADMIARTATRVIGLDYDRSAAEHVDRRYPSVAMTRGNLAMLPLRTESVDVVVNFQVIEHLWDQAEFLRECLRVLVPGGVLLVSTPNRITFSPGRDTPLNPFHTRELAAAELQELLSDNGFEIESMIGVHHGERLRELDAAHGGSFIDAQIDRALAGEPWPEALVADVAGITVDDFDIHAEAIDESLDLVAVARKPSST